MSLVVVAAAVLRQSPGGEVLLTQRLKGAHLAGKWEFPGGKLEEGEDPEAAVVRECREECGIEVRVEDILDVAHHAYEARQVLLLFYDCRPAGEGRPEVQHLGVADHRWVKPSDLGGYELPPPDQRLVAKLQSGQ